MSARILNMQGEDITPPPISFEQQFMENVIFLLQSMPIEEAIEQLFKKYKIELK